MNSKVSANELKELASKINAERSAILPDVYKVVKPIVEGIEGSSLTFSQYNTTRFTHENVSITAKLDPTSSKLGTLNLMLVELEEDIEFEVRKKTRTYPKGMQFLRLYAA